MKNSNNMRSLNETDIFFQADYNKRQDAKANAAEMNGLM